MAQKKKSTSPTHFHIVSLFPESIQSYLSSSILGKAQEKSAQKPGENARTKALIKISYYNPKDFSSEEVRVDARPYGGGPGMVLRPEPILKAVKKAVAKKKGAKIIFLGTAGKQFDEPMAKALAKKKDIVFICGRYEGIDARVKKILKADEVTVGPYVLTGGELPTATMIDAIARFVPGVLGKYESLENERVSAPEVYTRPDILVWNKKKHKVPEVLKSGNHALIEAWKKTLRP